MSQCPFCWSPAEDASSSCRECEKASQLYYHAGKALEDAALKAYHKRDTPGQEALQQLYTAAAELESARKKLHARFALDRPAEDIPW